MYGVIDFYRAAREAGIKPIIGCEVHVAPNSRFVIVKRRGEKIDTIIWSYWRKMISGIII